MERLLALQSQWHGYPLFSSPKHQRSSQPHLPGCYVQRKIRHTVCFTVCINDSALQGLDRDTLHSANTKLTIRYHTTTQKKHQEYYQGECDHEFSYASPPSPKVVQQIPPADPMCLMELFNTCSSVVHHVHYSWCSIWNVGAAFSTYYFAHMPLWDANGRLRAMQFYRAAVLISCTSLCSAKAALAEALRCQSIMAISDFSSSYVTYTHHTKAERHWLHDLPVICLSGVDAMGRIMQLSQKHLLC